MQGGENNSDTAGPNDFVAGNLTKIQGQNLVGKDRFDSHYAALEQGDDDWTLYEPVGGIRAIEITHEMTTALDVAEEFHIMAPWGSKRFATVADYPVAPLPALDEIYRTSQCELERTYALKESQ